MHDSRIPPNHSPGTAQRAPKVAGERRPYKTWSRVITERVHDVIFGSFGKFLVVGGIGFVINAVVLRVGVEIINWNPSIANLVGAGIAIFSNYNLNNLWTFSEHRISDAIRYVWKLGQFYATSAFGVIFIQTGTIFLADHIFGTRGYFLYFIVGTGFLLVWNFTIYNRVIWKKRQ
jgi:dolichol-phosphate mannosyltransferase